MSDELPIGPIIGAAVGLAAIAGTVKLTKYLLDDSKEEKQKIQTRKRVVSPSITSNNDNDRVQRGLNKMLYGGRQ
jgi:hypothetical protein